MRDHLVRWHEQFERDGLDIIEIDGGRYASLGDAKRGVERQEIRHHVLWDADDRNRLRYGVREWPTAVLVGRDGRVIWSGRPSRALAPREGSQRLVDRTTGAVLERLIQQALREQPDGTAELAGNRQEAGA